MFLVVGVWEGSWGKREEGWEDGWDGIYHAAPTTERPMHILMPRPAQAYGETVSRKRPTCRGEWVRVSLKEAILGR